MEYRQFGKLGWQGSVLGFGAMRLPVIDGKPGQIDEPHAREMVQYAVEQGVNYFDTAYPYHEGQSERCLGRILQQDGLREKVKVATKLPSWLVQSAGDFDRLLHEQFERLATDRIDVYLLHGLNRQWWPRLRDLGVLKWAEGAMADGRIGHLGFSFHDDPATFKSIVDGYDRWAMCQIQYNFMDIDFQAGEEGLRYAGEKGLAVVVMEPLRGGRLAKKVPPAAEALRKKAAPHRTPVEMALQWVWDHPAVSVVLSGMSSPDQVKENVAYAARAASGRLSAEERDVIAQTRQIYADLAPIPCTDCHYCLPCPNGVAIPRIFDLYNEAQMYDDPIPPRFIYAGNYGIVKPEQRGDRCTDCAECETRCPQGIAVRDWLKKAHAHLGPGL